MADAIAQVLDDARLRELLRANGLALARSFSWRTVGPKWIELYRQAVGLTARERCGSSQAGA